MRHNDLPAPPFSIRQTIQPKRDVMPAHSRSENGVALLAYVAGIHVFLAGSTSSKAWMAGTSPAMTTDYFPGGGGGVLALKLGRSE